MRRRSIQYASLTSLLDVLFLLLFAALVQRAAALEDAAHAGTAQGDEDALAAAADAGTDAAPDAQPAARPALERGLDALEERLRSGLAVLVTIRDERLVEIRARDATETRTLRIDTPLAEPSPDPDVGIVYTGEEDADQQICNRVAAELGADLSGALVVIELDAELERLPVALVDGLRADERRCASAGASAVILTPSAHLE